MRLLKYQQIPSILLTGLKIDLLAYCIMPNHIHAVFPLNETGVTRNSVSSSPNIVRTYRLTKVMQDFKKFTARESNKILKRTGQFWHHESYDHVIRNYQELEMIIHYILQNPVKAGFIFNYKEWKWSYLKEGLIEI